MCDRPVRIILTIDYAFDRNSGSPGTVIALGETDAPGGHDTDVLSLDDLAVRRGAQARFPMLVAGRSGFGRPCAGAARRADLPFPLDRRSGAIVRVAATIEPPPGLAETPRCRPHRPLAQ